MQSNFMLKHQESLDEPLLHNLYDDNEQHTKYQAKKGHHNSQMRGKEKFKHHQNYDDDGRNQSNQSENSDSYYGNHNESGSNGILQ